MPCAATGGKSGTVSQQRLIRFCTPAYTQQMPTAVLFCEGDDRSPDAPVLRAILHGLSIEVRPVGSRGIFRQMLLDHPDARALRDGDFPDDPDAWRPDPAAAPWPGEPDWQGWNRRQ